MRRPFLLPLVLLLLGATAPAAAAPPAPTSAASTIDHVLVYSNEARVQRSASVTLGAAPLRVTLADLPAAVDPDSVRVECETANVEHVEVQQTRDRLPRQAEARALLERIEQVTDKLRTLGDEQQVLRAELALIEGLRPASQPRSDKQPAALFPDAWRRILAWSAARAGRIRARLAAIDAERFTLEQTLQPLRVEARGLQLGAAEQPAVRVVATVRGKPGRHRLRLSYLVGRVRWVASYDLRYDYDRQSVGATYYAVLTQSSGEDWQAARLSFSTALPARLQAVPELPTWTLGRTSEMTPTPRVRPDPVPAAWRPPEPPAPADPALAQLAAALREADEAETGEVEALVEKAAQTGQGFRRFEARELENRVDALKKEVRRTKSKISFAEETVTGARIEGRDRDADGIPDSVDVAAATPAAPPPAPMGGSVRLLSAPAARRSSSWFGSGGRGTPTTTLPWTDTGYRPPVLDPELPAMAAKGYRFTLDAPGRHRVAADGAPARIPLMRRRFAVSPVYRIVPGRSTAAYLTAEVNNATGRPILRGQANLFAGAMFHGQTALETALPGAKLLLPLGVDDRVKVSRITSQRTVTEGVLFKDDVTEYTVRIEIANHRRRPIRIEVEDQVPLTRGDDVRVEGFASSPAMSAPDHDGRVTYKGAVGPSSVQALTFRYRIVRPKNWELTQHD